jgi:hypothetical protein
MAWCGNQQRDNITFSRKTHPEPGKHAPKICGGIEGSAHGSSISKAGIDNSKWGLHDVPRISLRRLEYSIIQSKRPGYVMICERILERKIGVAGAI